MLLSIEAFCPTHPCLQAELAAANTTLCSQLAAQQTVVERQQQERAAAAVRAAAPGRERKKLQAELVTASGRDEQLQAQLAKEQADSEFQQR